MEHISPQEYLVRVTEVLEKEVPIMAANEEMAKDIAELMHKDGMIVLDADDFIGVKFDV